MNEGRLLSVVIVDDEPAVLSTLDEKISWEDLGYEPPSLFSSAKKAYEHICEAQVDLLITDVQMPGLNGLELIERISMRRDDIHIIVISAFDHFEYIRRALQLGVRDYLLKPLDDHELTELLLAISEQQLASTVPEQTVSTGYVESFLYRWLHGSISAYELPERLTVAGIDLENKSMSIGMIRIFTSPQASQAEIYEQLVAACQKVIPRSIEWYCFRDELRQFVLFFSQPSEIEPPLEAACERLCEQIGTRINRINGLNYFIAVSPSTEEIERLPDLYRKTDHFIEYSLIKPVNTVLAVSQALDSAARISSVLEAINFDYIRSELLEEHEQEVFDYIVSSLRIFDEHPPAGLDLRFIIQEVLMTMARTIDSVTSGPSQGIEQWFEAFERVRSRSDFLSWLDEHVRKAVSLIQSGKSELSPVISQIISLMKSNLSDTGLCLKGIGYEVGMNPTYLGQLFRNETGMLFTKYLTELRIAEAKRLLDTTSQRVQDIADLIGFSNQSYFNKVFKKYTGLTPMEYKRKASYSTF